LQGGDVAAVAGDADGADRNAVDIEGDAARVAAETRGQAGGIFAATEIAGDGDGVGAKGVGKFNAEEGPGFGIDDGLGEIRSNDEARGSGGEGVLFAFECGGGAVA